MGFLGPRAKASRPWGPEIVNSKRQVSCIWWTKSPLGDKDFRLWGESFASQGQTFMF